MTGSHTENILILSVATLLDPRFEDRYFWDAAAKEEAKEIVRRLLREQQHDSFSFSFRID